MGEKTCVRPLDFGHSVSTESVSVSSQRESGVQLTQFSDYAIRLLMLLAMEEGHSITIGDAAAILKLSKNHLIKIANLLVRKDFIVGTRGRRGGIRLSRSSEDIRLGDIIRVTEPTLLPVQCMSTPGACSLENICRGPIYLQDAMMSFLSELDKATLADLVRNRRSAKSSC